VIQLALLLALSLLGSVLSFGLGRSEAERGGTTGTVKRAEAAVERASVSLLRHGAMRGLGLLLIPAVGLSAFAFVPGVRGGVSELGRAIFLIVALLCGGASAVLQARLIVGLAARASSGAAALVARGSTGALRPLIRASAAGALFGEALGVLGVSAAFAALYAVRGGFAGASDNADLASEIARLLPAFALGAAVVGLALSRAGGIAAAAAGIGSAHVSEPDAGLSPADPRDPALLADLVGRVVGEVMPRALVSYVASLGVTTALALLAASVGSGRALPYFATAMLIRAFGSIGAACGVLAARSAEGESATVGLFRAQVSAYIVASFGLGAALFWLERGQLGALFVSGELGLFASWVTGVVSWLIVRRPEGTREVHGARGAVAIARSASVALVAAWPALCLPALLLAVAEKIVIPATPAGFIAFASSALCLTPLSSALGGFGALVSQCRGVASLSRIEVEPERRKSSLDDAAMLGERSSGAQFAVALSLCYMLGLLALGGPSTAGTASLGLAALATALGVGLVLFLAAGGARSAASGSRLVSTEVERQLAEARERGGDAFVEFAPSYKACVELAASSAKASSMLAPAASLIAPFALALLLRQTGSAFTPTLLVFGTAVAATGVVVSLVSRATRAGLADLRRRARRNDLPGTAALSDADAFGQLVGVVGATHAESLALTLAISIICLAPLIR